MTYIDLDLEDWKYARCWRNLIISLEQKIKDTWPCTSANGVGIMSGWANFHYQILESVLENMNKLEKESQ